MLHYILAQVSIQLIFKKTKEPVRVFAFNSIFSRCFTFSFRPVQATTFHALIFWVPWPLSPRVLFPSCSELSRLTCFERFSFDRQHFVSAYDLTSPGAMPWWLLHWASSSSRRTQTSWLPGIPGCFHLSWCCKGSQNLHLQISWLTRLDLLATDQRQTVSFSSVFVVIGSGDPTNCKSSVATDSSWSLRWILRWVIRQCLMGGPWFQM